MICVYCGKEITWGEWLFRGHINARCETKQNEITKLKMTVDDEVVFDFDKSKEVEEE